MKSHRNHGFYKKEMTVEDIKAMDRASFEDVVEDFNKKFGVSLTFFDRPKFDDLAAFKKAARFVSQLKPTSRPNMTDCDIKTMIENLGGYVSYWHVGIAAYALGLSMYVEPRLGCGKDPYIAFGASRKNLGVIYDTLKKDKEWAPWVS